MRLIELIAIGNKSARIVSETGICQQTLVVSRFEAAELSEALSLSLERKLFRIICLGRSGCFEEIAAVSRKCLSGLVD